MEFKFPCLLSFTHTASKSSGFPGELNGRLASILSYFLINMCCAILYPRAGRKAHRTIRTSENSIQLCNQTGFPSGSEGKESACNAGDLGLIPGLGRSPEAGNSYPLLYSGLENSMDRGVWWSTVYGVTEGRT